jgi:hypothetical protein
VTVDRAVSAKAKHTLDLIEIDDGGTPLALRVARGLLLRGEVKGAIALRRIIDDPGAPDELQQGNRLARTCMGLFLSRGF